MAKFTLEVNSRLEFIIFVYNWSVPDLHTIYTSRSRYIESFDDIQDVLKLVEDSNVCHELPQDDDNKSRAIESTWEENIEKYAKSTIVRHLVPKLPSESHFQTSVTFKSPDCEVILDLNAPDAELCNPCLRTDKTVEKAEKKMKT
jgi:hypothetical protein